MELLYEFSDDDFLALCLKNFERKKTRVCEDLYETLKHFLSTPDSVVITDVMHIRHRHQHIKPSASIIAKVRILKADIFTLEKPDISIFGLQKNK